MEYVQSKTISMKSHQEFNERWLQQVIASDPSILGLGDLDVKDAERRQPGSGRLDLLLFDAESNTRYEVEIQLGATDESHIIRTLEYWDLERRRWPQYEHVAVIVAENITGRFLNVINLFNQAIPLIAIQMSALDVDGVLTLHATRVLDLALPAPEEDDEPGGETDRKYWEQRSNPSVMELLDRVERLVNGVMPGYQLKYNKHYVGLQKDKISELFVLFRPRRRHLIIEWRIDRSDEVDQLLEDSGAETMTYDNRWKRYRAQFTPADFEDHEALIVDFLRRAKGLPVVGADDSAAG